MEISFQDKTFIKRFFNTGGYVLDFSNSTFGQFTFYSVGIDVQEKYGLSKGKSFEAFVNEEDGEMVLKLSLDLLDYYDNLPDSSIEKNEERTKQAKKLRERLLEYQSVNSKHITSTAQKVSDYFDNLYIDKQIAIMTGMIQESPADSIGKAKELLESCFKHILDLEGTKYSNSDDIASLQKKVFQLLNLDVNKNISAKNNEDVKRILSGLNQVIKGINNLRNDKGDGHGKGRSFSELPPRYASLVVGASITIVTFVWETYNDKNDK
ncbi:TPA: abortive infection family protein [Streptococcus suis]